MRSLSCVLRLAVLSSLYVTLAPSGAWATASGVCDGVHVKQRGKSLTVSPTGTDDTANLQCALDRGIAAGPGATLNLTSGSFHTAQLIASNFQGTLRGNGINSTILQNLPNLPVAVDFRFFPPSAGNLWPSLLAFVDGRFTVTDLAIHVESKVGSEPTTGWSVFGLPMIKSLAHGFVVLGKRAEASFSRVSVQGQPSDDWLFGVNLYNGIFFEGFIGADPAPLAGSFTVRDSSFSGLGSGTPIVNLKDAEVVIAHNTFVDVLLGMDGGDVTDSTLTFVGNSVRSLWNGLDLADNGFQPRGASGSRLVIAANRFTGASGPRVELTFGDDVGCWLVLNDTSAVTGIGTYLGPGTKGCVVITQDPGSVVDDGTGNLVISRRR